MYSSKAIRNACDLISQVNYCAQRLVGFKFAQTPGHIYHATRFPSEAHEQAIQEVPYHGDAQSFRGVEEFINLPESRLNYFRDHEGNSILDFNAAAAGHVLGYNHLKLRHWRKCEHYDRFVTKKTDPSSVDATDLADVIREFAMPAAPKGMRQVHLGGSSGTEANELAMSVAMQGYSRRHNVAVENLSVIGFSNSQHGSSTATLSVSSDAANVDEVATHNWPKAEFPQLCYPLADCERENRAEEDRCLEGFRNLIASQRAAGQHVAAIIVEPISSFGNQLAPPYFFKQLRRITASEGISMIVDETKTGMGASGNSWAHEYWYLQEEDTPDFLTFGGKAGLGGFYSTLEHRLNDEAVSFSQTPDMEKLITYGRTWEVIEKDSLLDLNKDTSSFLKIELERVGRHTGLISNVRGYGTHLGFECKDAAHVQKWLMRGGLNLFLCGPSTFALRPSLYLGVHEAKLLRDQLMHYSPNFE